MRCGRCIARGGGSSAGCGRRSGCCGSPDAAACGARAFVGGTCQNAQWEKDTAAGFTTVQQDGSFFTRAERLANLRTQTPRPYVPRSREHNERRGDVVIARFFSGGLWVLEVWTRESGAWQVLTSQVTTAKP